VGVAQRSRHTHQGGTDSFSDAVHAQSGAPTGALAARGLTRIFTTACSKADGLRRIRFWRRRVVRSGLTCFDRFLNLLDTWLDLIANYVVDHQTSSFVEGLNNKLNVLKRRWYGMRNIGRLF
jgi:transposase